MGVMDPWKGPIDIDISTLLGFLRTIGLQYSNFKLDYCVAVAVSLSLLLMLFSVVIETYRSENTKSADALHLFVFFGRRR